MFGLSRPPRASRPARPTLSPRVPGSPARAGSNSDQERARTRYLNASPVNGRIGWHRSARGRFLAHSFYTRTDQEGRLRVPVEPLPASTRMAAFLSTAVDHGVSREGPLSAHAAQLRRLGFDLSVQGEVAAWSSAVARTFAGVTQGRPQNRRSESVSAAHR
jgi:hypothetical protein